MSAVILDQSRIEQMLRDPAIIQAFPFMKSAAAALTAKGCKCSRATVSKARDYGQLKQIIATMPAEKKVKLKELLHADTIEFTYVNARSLKVQHSF